MNISYLSGLSKSSAGRDEHQVVSVWTCFECRLHQPVNLVYHCL